MEYYYDDDDSNESDYSSDTYEYPAPSINLPHFLCTNYKWNETVQKTDSMQSYINLIGKITNLNFPDEGKYVVMYFLTNDIVDKHKNLNPHWKLLKQHALFSKVDFI